MDEKSVCANIQRFAEQLNGELQAAFEMGLKVRVHAKGLGIFTEPTAAYIAVKVWREHELVDVSAPNRPSKLSGVAFNIPPGLHVK